MKINIIDQKNGYSFDLRDSRNKLLFSSNFGYFLTSFVESNYKYAWKACSDAHDLMHNRNYHFAFEDMSDFISVDVSAEEMLIDHYKTILEGMDDKARSANTKKIKEIVKGEIEMILSELAEIKSKIEDGSDKRTFRKLMGSFQSIINRYLKTVKSTKEASLDNIWENSSYLKKEIMREYADKACEALQTSHDSCFYMIEDVENGIISICKFEDTDHPILKIFVNDKMHITDVIPNGTLSKIYPLHSVGFYQKYWKPIMESIGHFFIEDLSLLILCPECGMPDTPNKDKIEKVMAWDSSKKNQSYLDISFNKDIWLMNASRQERIASNNISKYTEQDYVNALVQCIDPSLESINGRKGEVVQVIPREDMIEIDVDFGRGIDVVRLTEDQIQKIA